MWRAARSRAAIRGEAVVASVVRTRLARASREPPFLPDAPLPRRVTRVAEQRQEKFN
jgi:hypothetical protein